MKTAVSTGCTVISVGKGYHVTGGNVALGKPIEGIAPYCYMPDNKTMGGASRL